MPRADHWEEVYRSRSVDDVSWYRPHLEQSLAFFDAADLPARPSVLDVGGGASTLVDDLLARDAQVTVVDLSEGALAHSRRRLGAERAARVRWIAGDITQVALPRHALDLWHDRAVFHFLTRPADRHRYVAQLRHALRPGGYVAVGTFAHDGPSACSGLPVARYRPPQLAEALGADLEVVATAREVHRTPRGRDQPFSWVLARRPADGVARLRGSSAP